MCAPVPNGLLTARSDIYISHIYNAGDWIFVDHLKETGVDLLNLLV